MNSGHGGENGKICWKVKERKVKWWRRRKVHFIHIIHEIRMMFVIQNKSDMTGRVLMNRSYSIGAATFRIRIYPNIYILDPNDP